jgi:predicted RNase H-like nuclease (RuvC/YqgF family)
MKIAQIIIIVILAALAIVFGIVWMNAAKENKALIKSNEDLQSLYESSTATISEIQESLQSLDQDLTGQLFTQGEIPNASPADRRDRIITSIANMRDQIEADKKKIAQLEGQLANSRTQLRGVQDMVNRLKASLDDKERIMSELQDRLGIMDETIEAERRLSQMAIAEREQTIAERDQALIDAEREADTIYYVVGTRKQLMDQGIIDRKGGILGIGRVTTINKKIATEKFTEINLQDSQQITFKITNKGYSILSNHIATTYNVEKVDGEYVLTVTDKENFRKQKFLVIELL